MCSGQGTSPAIKEYTWKESERGQNYTLESMLHSGIHRNIGGGEKEAFCNPYNIFYYLVPYSAIRVPSLLGHLNIIK